MIGLSHVTFGYADKPVFHDFTLELPETGVVCLSGPSGCGKTTALRLIAGLETPASGTVEGLKNHRIAFLFQEDRLLPWMTAYSNVALISAEKADSLLRELGLWESRDRFPSELSGGMRRRLALARALALDADVLLLDEPFNGLDRTLWTQIAALLRERYRDKLIIMVTHVQEEAQLMGAVDIPLPSPIEI